MKITKGYYITEDGEKGELIFNPNDYIHAINSTDGIKYWLYKSLNLNKGFNHKQIVEICVPDGYTHLLCSGHSKLNKLILPKSILYVNCDINASINPYDYNLDDVLFELR